LFDGVGGHAWSREGQQEAKQEGEGERDPEVAVHCEHEARA
jgi:hypothetical protein